MKINIKAQIAIGLVCLILAFLITIQFRSVTKNNEAIAQNVLRMEELQSELTKERGKNEDLQGQIDQYKSDLDNYRKEAENTSGYYKMLNEQLKRAEIMAGMVDVTGPGIVVTLKDGTAKDANVNPNAYLIHDSDILRVVNELMAGGAEAISVNENRITGNSAIRCAGPTIIVNDEKTTPPYIIKAIGKPETLSASLNMNGGIVMEMQAVGIEVDIKQQNDVIVPKYNGTMTYKNATIVETNEGGNQ